ncbi:MAG: methylmalonyl-CoA mutase [Deltaproteobacteria bacterium]|nr:MAG: methylmalonyl-CoA mutase [Deltaproteobacteria bacterium]
MKDGKIKILIAKPDLDGHDRGGKVVAFALRDAGMQVTYSGLHRSIDQIVKLAIQGTVEIIGLSIMTGAHLSICRRLLEMLEERGVIGSIRVVVGGVIPKQDIPKLKEMGIDGIFPGGSRFDEIVETIQAIGYDLRSGQEIKKAA